MNCAQLGQGQGSVLVSNGGTVAASTLSVGQLSGAIGTVNISGGSMTVSASTNIGAAAGATGTVTVNGPSASFTDQSFMRIGEFGDDRRRWSRHSHWRAVRPLGKPESV